MRLPPVERQEAELEAEGRVKFKGTARIRLESLDFPRQGANENVERLKLCIECEGCYRLGSKFHVSAIIDQKASGWRCCSFQYLPCTSVRGVGIDFEPVKDGCMDAVGVVAVDFAFRMFRRLTSRSLWPRRLHQLGIW